MKVEYFRSKKKTNRFNANQKVWIRLNCANHLYVWFKWRGSGRYVSGVLDKFANCVGEIKEIEVDESFARHIYGNLTPLALDGGDSAALQALSTPEVLSTLQGESTPAHRK